MAGYNLSVDVIGGDTLEKVFSSANEICMKALADALNATANETRSKAQELAPHRTGNLQGSIHTEYATLGTKELQATVGTNVPYAIYQEKGVKPFGVKTAKSLIMTDQNGNVTAYFKRSRGFKGKFFMKQAREFAKPLLTTYMEGALKVITAELAK